MNTMNFGVLIANGFKKLILDSKTFYVRSTNDPIYQFSGRTCDIVTDFDLVQTIEEKI